VENERAVDRATDDDVRDVNDLWAELAGSALGERTQAALGCSKRGETSASAQRRCSASEQD
jgi:hypothetical protein